jgi:uncharacterized protein (DUF305 family)
MSRWLYRYRLSGLLAAILCWGVAAPSHAGRDILDQSVTLASEADLMHAVSAALQHALVTTKQFQARTPRLQRFVRKELETHRKNLKVLTKRASINPPDIKKLAIEPKDERQYVQAMLRNHARLLELIELGLGLSLSPDIKRMMAGLAESASQEFSTLSSLERSQNLAAIKAGVDSGTSL